MTSASVRSRFNVTWQTPYAAPSLQVPWYVVAGNHDWEGNVTAEVAATSVYPLWHMPSLYYTFNAPIPFSSQTVQFVMIDTESLTGGDAGQVDSAPPSVAQPSVDEVQWAWVTSTLATSTADWIVVVGHFPVYSAGENGPTPALVTRLLPLMEAAGVALYISGHDHQLEHIGPAASITSASGATAPGVVDFVVSGAGAKYNETSDHEAELPADTLKFQYGMGCGFATVHVSREGWAPSVLTVTYWNAAGNVLYSFTKPNPRVRFMPPAPPRPPHPPNPFNTASNRMAVGVGAVGVFGGCLVIFSGLAKALSSPAPPATARALPPRPGGGGGGGSASVMERGEKAGLLLQQRGLGYGGVASGSQGSAQRLTNRL